LFNHRFVHLTISELDPDSRTASSIGTQLVDRSVMSYRRPADQIPHVILVDAAG
jgi:hypothetical protein